MKNNKEVKLCFACMEEHEVCETEIMDKGTFKNELVTFPAVYEYCSKLDEYSENEDMMKKNNLSQKDAYRKKVGLLTSSQIKAIRKQYGISQKDFSEVLGWGGATITRYENYQVQDRAHDNILRKIKSDPRWFLEMLESAKGKIGSKAHASYYSNGVLIANQITNPYKFKTGTTSVNIDNIYQSKVSIQIDCELGNYTVSKYNTNSASIEPAMAKAA